MLRCLSGRPLRQRSTELFQKPLLQTGSMLPIIGVGGVASADDAREKLDAGAAVVQLYSALIYAGPRLPGRILRDLAA